MSTDQKQQPKIDILVEIRHSITESEFDGQSILANAELNHAPWFSVAWRGKTDIYVRTELWDKLCDRSLRGGMGEQQRKSVPCVGAATGALNVTHNSESKYTKVYNATEEIIAAAYDEYKRQISEAEQVTIRLGLP